MNRTKLLACVVLVVLFALFAFGSGDDTTVDQGNGTVATSSSATVSQETDAVSSKTEVSSTPSDQLGDYKVVIDSCRLAKDYEKKPVAIVKYIFTNVSHDEAISFGVALNADAYQNGIGLNTAIILDDSVKYESDRLLKAIKKGATLEVEIAYVLDDSTTDLVIEVKELFSFDDTMITKTFSLQ